MLAQLSGSLLHSLHHFQRRGRGVGGRAWTLPGSFLHLHRGRGGGEGLDHASPLSLTLPSPLTPAVGMLLPASQGGLQHGSQPLSLPAPAR